MNPVSVILLLATALVAAPLHAHDNAAAHAASEAGQAGQAAAVRRTVTVGMHDAMRFSPSHFTARQGETLRLEVVNEGQVMHELVLGTAAEIRQLRQLMQRHPDMPHAAPFMVHVAPGERAGMVWQFDRSGVFEIACLLPGHYEAGMRGSVSVQGERL